MPKQNRNGTTNDKSDDVKKDPIDPMDLIDPKASEQVLAMIVKIAEHPATWKQIHRVLETLEANNAAYSRRIDGTTQQLTTRELGWMNKRTDRPGDKRNDVPEELEAPSSLSSTTIVPYSSVDTNKAFLRWREALFASGQQVDDEDSSPLHPQLIESSVITPESTTTSSPFIEPTMKKKKKNFEERLSDIEEELKKLSKLSRSVLKSRNNQASKSSIDDESKNKKVAKQHPKFQYHKVHDNTNSSKINSSTAALEPKNFWKRVASLKRGEPGTNRTSGRRNTFVAVSLAPKAATTIDPTITGTGDEPQQKLTSKPCFNNKKKNRHNLWKQRQRLKLNQGDNSEDEILLNQNSHK